MHKQKVHCAKEDQGKSQGKTNSADLSELNASPIAYDAERTKVRKHHAATWSDFRTQRSMECLPSRRR